MLKALQHERRLDELEHQRAERLIQLAQQQRDFSRAIRIALDEAVIQDIINPVSSTHLDVYKRQMRRSAVAAVRMAPPTVGRRRLVGCAARTGDERRSARPAPVPTPRCV